MKWWRRLRIAVARWILPRDMRVIARETLLGMVCWTEK